MILVAGGSGRLGVEVVERLVREGHQVRVLTRNPDRARGRLPAAVDITVGDVRDWDALCRAARGAGVVVSAVQGLTGMRGNSPITVDRDGNRHLVDAARDSGASVVLMSIVGASPDSPFELFRMKAAAEDYLWARAVSGTVVRASAFVELHLETLMRSARGGRPVVLGRGDRKQNFVSVRDVAAVVCWAVDDPAARGRTIEVIGPDNLTMTELAQALQRAQGWSGSPRHVPTALLKATAATAGLVLPPVRRVIGSVLAGERMDLTAQPGEPPTDWPLPVTTVKDILSGLPSTPAKARTPHKH